ncbi:50S ribosomal protein L32 [Candidatus Dojkabacteria bacterium]|uniref:Large ribosomal subunit protein bL32 n=1 Tax=Candidatus Dojkabacteria bacterium TaxID=2099670 RepID=A0A955L652_9BACT|nr:50S ribosomal protein L32 [Candidatus Dojkabacteria bacterium]
MGALPKRKISKQRKRNRRSHHAIDVPTLVKCPDCNSMKLPHQVCQECGTYKGIQVLQVE